MHNQIPVWSFQTKTEENHLGTVTFDH